MTLRQPFIRITPQKIMFVKTRTEYNLYHFLNEPSIQTKELHSVQNKTISISISKKLEKNSAKAVMTCLTSANVTIKNHISISPKTLFENPYVSLLGLLFILVTTTSIQAIKIREKQLDHERIRTSLADTIKMEEKSTQKNNKKLAKSLLILFEIPIVIDKCSLTLTKLNINGTPINTQLLQKEVTERQASNPVLTHVPNQETVILTMNTNE